MNEHLKIKLDLQGDRAAASGLDRTRRKVKGLGDESTRTGRKFQVADGHSRRFGGGLRRLGGLMAAGGAAVGIYGLGRAVVTTGKSLARIEGIGRQTNAVIGSTAGVANVSRRGLDSLAGALERKTSLEAEQITQGGNQLLTFTKIRNEVGRGNKVYDRALVSMTDYVASMKLAGRDVSPAAAAILYGKALNDPIKGMGALGKVGVQFTKQQKEQITKLQESGNIMGAQKVILKELETQYGGSGKALGQSVGGIGALIGHEFGTIQESLGQKLMPSFLRGMKATRIFAQGMVDGTGKGGEFADRMKTLGGHIATVAGKIKAAYDKGKDFKKFLEGTGPAADTANIAIGGLVGGLIAYKAITAGIAISTGAWAFAQGLLNTAMSLNPVVLVIAAIVGLGVALVVAYKKVGWFRDAVDTAWKWIKIGVGGLGDAFSAVWGGIKSGFRTMIDWVTEKWDAFANKINGGISAVSGLPGVPDDLPTLPTFGGRGAQPVSSMPVQAGEAIFGSPLGARSIQPGSLGKKVSDVVARGENRRAPREVVLQVNRRELGRAFIDEAAWNGARA